VTLQKPKAQLLDARSPVRNGADAESYRMLYLPRRFGHGFQTLRDDTEVFYEMSDFCAPETARGIRRSDPAFSTAWPPVPAGLSPRGRSFPDFDGSSFEEKPA
jgi:dTDP-4-dehydrorhamnose 3,5-epimerase